MTTETRLGVAVALGQLVVVLDTTIALVAVPTLMRHFDASLSAVQWVTVAYVLALVVSMPLAAWVSARLGPRRTYVSVLVAFAVFSVAAGCAPSLGTLVAARVAMGLAGGLVNPVGMTLAMGDVPASRRGRMGALLGLPVLIGPLLGPITAAWLVDSVSWRAVFWVTVPPALVAAALVHRIAPADRSPAQRPAFDTVGFALLVPGATALVLGVGDSAGGWAVRSMLVAAGAVAVLTFALRSWRRDDALLKVRLFGRTSYRRSFTVAGLFAGAYFGSMLLSPTYVQVIRGDNAQVSGVLAIPAGLATGVSLQICTRLIDRIPAHHIITAGLAVAACSLLAIVAFTGPHTSYLVWGALTAAVGAGSGAVMMPTMTTAIRELSGPDLSSGTAMLTVGNQLCNAFGNAAIVAVYSAMSAVFAAGEGGQVDALRVGYLVACVLVVVAVPIAWRIRPVSQTVRPQMQEVHA